VFLEQVLDKKFYTDVQCKLQPATLNDIYSVLLLFTYVHAYVNYQKPFHSSLTRKQLPYISADIKKSFSPHADGYQAQTPEKYTTQPYTFFCK
jgi:hypothetical protein